MQRIYGLMFLLCVAVSGMAQQKIRTVFVNMPDSVLPMLTKVNRADCIDFLDCNMKAEVRNRMGGNSEMTGLTDDWLTMKLTSQSSVEMKLLPMSDSLQLVAMIHTVCGKACDSRIRFYSTAWEPLSTEKYFASWPESHDFLPDTISSVAEDTLGELWSDFRKKADICLLTASFSPEQPLLYFEYATPEYMDSEDAMKLRPLLKNNRICYEWKAGRFVRRVEQ